MTAKTNNERQRDWRKRMAGFRAAALATYVAGEPLEPGQPVVIRDGKVWRADR